MRLYLAWQGGSVRQIVNPFHMFLLLMGLFTVYVILMIVCGVHASSLFTVIKHETSNEIDDVKLDEVLMNVSTNES